MVLQRKSKAYSNRNNKLLRQQQLRYKLAYFQRKKNIVI